MLSFVLYTLITLFFSYLGVRVGLRQRLSTWTRGAMHGGDAPPKLLDTSVIIDGRILEIVQAGFVDGRLIVPKFVLRELQTIADSVDGLKRGRGRRGLEVLSQLRDISQSLEVLDRDVPERDVDSKLVVLARDMGAHILTNDFNLNRVASLQGVKILNINQLANALKAVVIPGEAMAVTIVKDGKELNQGVGISRRRRGNRQSRRTMRSKRSYRGRSGIGIADGGRAHDLRQGEALKSMAPTRVTAILAAAGRGARLGMRKQLHELEGKPVAAWSLATIASCAIVTDVVIACEADEREAFARPGSLARRRQKCARGRCRRRAPARFGLCRVARGSGRHGDRDRA